MRWWGWGDRRAPPALPRARARVPARAVGVGAAAAPAGGARAGAPAGPRAGSAERSRELRAIVGAEHVRDGHAERVLHAAGKGYPDLVRLRAGEPEGAPDAVALPARATSSCARCWSCARAARWRSCRSAAARAWSAASRRCAARTRGVLALDIEPHGGRCSSSTGVGDGHRRQAGMRAPALERHLAARGLTLGHFPQSFEYVSLGGCAATRSAGQASTGYGAIEKMVLGLRLAAPGGGDRRCRRCPRAPPGPALRQLLVGSEGTLGVISELALRVRPAPRERDLRRRLLRGLRGRRGRRCGRSRASTRCRRRAALRRGGDAHVARARGQRRRRRDGSGAPTSACAGTASGCLAILGFEGSADGGRAAGARARSRSCAARRARASGARPARRGCSGRFARALPAR